jgi:L-asparaginase II
VSAPALLAEVRRGAVVEASVRGHVAVVDAQGRLIAGAGDPETLTTMRSAVKPLQALAFIESGAAAAIGAGDSEVAIACASHGATFAQLLAVRELLARAGAKPSMLTCGPQMPADAEAAADLVGTGELPAPIHNNCSGKHAAMIATCLHRGWPVEGYARADHPMQAAVAEAMGRCAGLDLGAVPSGIDGCGLPTYGLSVRTLARAFAAAASTSDAFQRCQHAMAVRPDLVAGRGRFDSVLLAAAGERLTGKSGGGGIWAAVSRSGGPAVAVKLEDGDGSRMAPVAIAVLQAVDLLPGELAGDLAEQAAGAMRNWSGDVVGGTTATVQLIPE